MIFRLLLLILLAPRVLWAQGTVVCVPAPPLAVNPANPYSRGVNISPGLGDTPSYDIDLNGDGIVDFTLTSVLYGQAFDIIPAGSNAVIAFPVNAAGSTDAANLGPGEVVGPQIFSGAKWQQRIDTPFGLIVPNITAGFSTGLEGLFAETYGFLGVKFMQSNEVHYGYLQIDCFGDGSGSRGMLEGFAWNRTADAAITTTIIPQPGTEIFMSTFSGGNEVPSITSGHMGYGKFYLSGNTMFSEMVSDYAFRPYSAGIYGPASPRENSRRQVANVQVIPPPPPPMDFNLPDVALFWSYNTLTRPEINQLRNGLLYVNFQSTNFPHGELRGQILSSSPLYFTGILNRCLRADDFGEASFVLTGNNLAFSVALSTNASWSSLGVFGFPCRRMNSEKPVIAIDLPAGVVIPKGGIPGEPGSPGQRLYQGEISLTDRQAAQFRRGNSFLRASGFLTPGAKIESLGEIHRAQR